MRIEELQNAGGGKALARAVRDGVGTRIDLDAECIAATAQAAMGQTDR